MQALSIPQVAGATIAAFLAGAINSVAGGGTLITFPTLVAIGLPSITANATSTVAIWPGTLGSIWGFRRELGKTPSRMRTLAIASFLGGAAGAVLLRLTPPSLFDRLVPFLILMATVLFTVRGRVQKHLAGKGLGTNPADIWLPGAMVFQFFIAIYGGYFGAGVSIMMLSALGILGMTDILQMNALTSLFSLCINGVASALFISAGMVFWPCVIPMAIAAIAGGYGAAGLARRLGRTAVSRFVIAVGFSMSILLFIRTFLMRG